MDPLSTARYGLMAAERRLSGSADRLVRGDADPAAEAVEQLEAKTAFAANARVIRFADETWRALLDVQAG